MGMAPKTIGVWGCAVRKLFESNDIQLRRRVRIKIFTMNESILPSREDFLKVVNSSDQRARTAILILASSGLRIGELHNLKLKDVNMPSEPPTIRVRGMGAKERKGRITFMSDEAKACLEAYLERRKAMGHAIAEDSPLMARDDGNSMTMGNLGIILGNAFKVVARKEGKYYTLHPHVLRKWFKTQLITGGMPGPIADRLCGHARYMAQEYELYTEEQLRKWYVKAMPNLRILSKPIEEEKLRQSVALEAIRRIAETYGIDPLRVKIEKQRELGREPSSEEEIQLIQNEIRKTRAHEDDPKKIVDEDELERYLGDGWDVQTVLPSGRILVRKP